MKKIIIKNKTIKINEGIKRVGKDEMNLVELPFTLLTKRNTNELKTIETNWIGKNENGKEKTFYKIITGSDKWGLPTFIAEEVFLACMELSYKQGFKNRKVHTNKHELIKLMGWDYCGASCKRLTKAFDQLLGVVIKTNAFWDNESKKYRELGLGIIDNYMFFEDEKRGKKNTYNQPNLPLGFFHWNEVFFEHSIQKNNIKTLDIELYFSLNSSISKRLYRYADKKIYQQELFEIDLFKLAFEKMEMRGNYKYPSEIIRKLKPAIKELKERNLVDITIKKSKTESGYKVCFKPIIKSQITKPNITELKADKSNTASELVSYFHQQLTPEVKDHSGNDREIQQAEELLLKCNKEEIKHIINYAIDQAKKTKFDMQYFGAVLNYSDKAIDQLQRKTKQNKKVKKLKEKTDAQEQVKQQYEIYKQSKIISYCEQLEKDEHLKLLEEAENIFIQNNPILKKGSIFYQEVFKSQFNDDLVAQGKVDVLSFEEWQQKRK